MINKLIIKKVVESHMNVNFPKVGKMKKENEIFGGGGGRGQATYQWKLKL